MKRPRSIGEVSKATHPILGQAANEEISQSGRALPLAHGEDIDPMHEMHLEASIGPQGKDVVVILGGSGACDADLVRRGTAGCQQLSCPPKASIASCSGVAALVTITFGEENADRCTVIPVDWSQVGTARGPAVHVVGAFALRASSNGRHTGESSVIPTISTEPKIAGA
jgi:hypothetical protein